MKILIVEDEGVIAMHLEMVVAGLGHEVCAVASTTAAAIENAGIHRPDTVLMDLRLARGSSGVQAARDIYIRFGIRAIFLSANLDESTRKALMPYEPIDFLGKPFLPADLERALKKLSCCAGCQSRE